MDGASQESNQRNGSFPDKANLWLHCYGDFSTRHPWRGRKTARIHARRPPGLRINGSASSEQEASGLSQSRNDWPFAVIGCATWLMFFAVFFARHPREGGRRFTTAKLVIQRLCLCYCLACVLSTLNAPRRDSTPV